MEMRPVLEIGGYTAEINHTILHAALAKHLTHPFVKENDVPFLGLLRRYAHVADQWRLVSSGSAERSITTGKKHVQLPQVSCNLQGS